MIGLRLGLQKILAAQNVSASSVTWILATAIWNDSGEWFDSSTWNDS